MQQKRNKFCFENVFDCKLFVNFAALSEIFWLNILIFAQPDVKISAEFHSIVKFTDRLRIMYNSFLNLPVIILYHTGRNKSATKKAPKTYSFVNV